VEVTRIVEREITAPSAPTRVPTLNPTPEPSSTPAPPSVRTQLLQRLVALGCEIEVMTFDSGTVWCNQGQEDPLTDHYESIVGYPSYEVASASSAVQQASSSCREAIDTIASTNRDLYTFCVDFLAKDSELERTTPLTWMPARQGIDQALGLIIPAINLLQSQ